MIKRELLQMALDAIAVSFAPNGNDYKILNAATEALKAELAKPEPEPVAWMMENDALAYKPVHSVPMYDWHESWKAIPLYRKEDL